MFFSLFSPYAFDSLSALFIHKHSGILLAFRAEAARRSDSDGFLQKHVEAIAGTRAPPSRGSPGAQRARGRHPLSRTGGLGPGLGAHVGDGGLGFALVTFGAPSLRRLSLRIGRRKPSASRRCKLRIEFCLTLNGKKKKIKKRQTESKRRAKPRGSAPMPSVPGEAGASRARGSTALCPQPPHRRARCPREERLPLIARREGLGRTRRGSKLSPSGLRRDGLCRRGANQRRRGEELSRSRRNIRARDGRLPAAVTSRRGSHSYPRGLRLAPRVSVPPAPVPRTVRPLRPEPPLRRVQRTRGSRQFVSSSNQPAAASHGATGPAPPSRRVRGGRLIHETGSTRSLHVTLFFFFFSLSYRFFFPSLSAKRSHSPSLPLASAIWRPPPPLRGRGRLEAEAVPLPA